ncbi:MAG: hypothetical protein O9282_02990 [Flavobacterium sp.]|jgi:hypothetical protein|uniref:hypothetical protein n=1 Tax=Flavobacterium sp. TaxID=239 RepID=UPI0022CA2207|nr:hypothetical protein [Flavobacterium sp.]MCZ8330259.1 hypothetical protein [Flavobacterium sp.]
MKKIEFSFKNLELVKGCPTDINGNGQEDDDYNGDGNVDQYDQDYFDGYMAGYEGDLNENFGDENCDAYNAGYHDGMLDEHGDTRNLSGSESGADILNENFQGWTGY